MKASGLGAVRSRTLYAITLVLAGVFVYLGFSIAHTNYWPLLTIIGGVILLGSVTVVSSRSFLVLVSTVVVPVAYSYALVVGGRPGDIDLWIRVARDLVFVLLAINLIFRAVRRQYFPLWHSRKSIPIILLLGYVGYLAILPFDLPLPTWWVGVRYYALFPLVGLLVPVSIRKREDLYWFFTLLFGISIGVGVLGIIEVILGNPFHLPYVQAYFFSIRLTRASSTFAQPNALAGFLGMVLAFWHTQQKHIHEIFRGRRRFLIGLIFWLCFLFTFSRSGIICLIIAFGIFQIFHSHRASFAKGILLALMVFPITSFVFWLRVPGDFEQGTWFFLLERRLPVWDLLLEDLFNRPVSQILLGSGLGSSAGEVNISFGILASSIEQAGRIVTDNFYLTLFFEMGLVGLVIMLLVALSYLRLCTKMYRELDDPFMRDVCAGLFVGMVFFLTRNMFLQGMRTLPAGFYFWVVVGLLLAVSNLSEEEEISISQDLSITTTAYR